MGHGLAAEVVARGKDVVGVDAVLEGPDGRDRLLVPARGQHLSRRPPMASDNHWRLYGEFQWN